MLRTSIVTSIGFCVLGAANAGDLMPWDPSLAKPFTYKDPRTSIVLYVETDGKHVAAIDAEGKLLWVRSPLKEAGFDGPETKTPVIDGLKGAELPPPQYMKWLQQHGFKIDHAHIRITFADRSFGLMDEKTGDFILEGQN
jgi:hypothetical protein